MIRFSLRLPNELHQRIKQVADQEQRSMNDQMIVMLREGVSKREVKTEGLPRERGTQRGEGPI